MSGHTKGPWIAAGPSRPTLDTPEGGDFAIAAGREIIAEVFRRTSTTVLQDAHANAHLIAAAPELWDALVELVERREQRAGRVEGGSDGRYDRARAAIAKARGP